MPKTIIAHTVFQENEEMTTICIVNYACIKGAVSYAGKCSDSLGFFSSVHL